MLGSDDAAFANIVNPFSASDADLESEPVVQLTLPEDLLAASIDRELARLIESTSAPTGLPGRPSQPSPTPDKDGGSTTLPRSDDIPVWDLGFPQLQNGTYDGNHVATSLELGLQPFGLTPVTPSFMPIGPDYMTSEMMSLGMLPFGDPALETTQFTETESRGDIQLLGAGKDAHNDWIWTFDCLTGEARPITPNTHVEGRVPVPIAPKTLPSAPKTPATASQNLKGGSDSQSQLAPIGKPKRKRFDTHEREKVKRVRRLGACFRCKIYKLPCDEAIPCVNCLKSKDTQKVYRGPCVRPNIDEVQTFRAGDGDNGHVRAVLPIFMWSSIEKVKTIELQWPFRVSANKSPVLTIDLHEFRPTKEILTEEWSVNGEICKVFLPPWACRDTKITGEAIGLFMSECQGLLEDEILDTLKDEPILSLGWKEANRYRATHNSCLIRLAQEIYAGAMMNSRYPAPVEADVFGVMAEMNNRPYFIENVPLPAQLIFQLQTMIGLAMMDKQKQALKVLKRKIFSKDRFRDWYEVFLAIFVLLATIEWVYQVQMRFVNAKQGVSERNRNNLSYVTQCMLDEWEASAFNLVAHFRCVMNGDVPFSQSWDEGADNPRSTGLDDEALAFVRKIKRETEKRTEELHALRREKGKSRFQRPLAALCELFLPAEDER